MNLKQSLEIKKSVVVVVVVVVVVCYQFYETY